MDKIAQKLENLGISPKECKVFLAVLAQGKSNLSQVAKKAGIKRTSVYQYINSLLQKGLVFKTTDRKRVLYSAIDPQKITGVLEKEKGEIEKRIKNVEKIIPELKSLYSITSNRPKVSYYESKEGIREVYEEILNTHKNVCSYFSPENFFKLFSYEENEKLLMLLYNSGGQLRNLMEKSEEAKKRLQIKKYGKFVKNKLLPVEIRHNTDMLICGNKIALISFRNLIGVIIEDEALADLQRDLFRYIWKTL